VDGQVGGVLVVLLLLPDQRDRQLLNFNRSTAPHKHKHTNTTQNQGWFELKNNTSVYVMGLPFDTTEGEVAAYFSKCGLIKEGPDAQPRIKLYR